jgi:hypothetical protein
MAIPGFNAFGRRWLIALDEAAIGRIKALTKFDLTDGAHLDLMLGRVRSNPTAIIDVLWAVLHPQAEAVGITRQQFAGGLTARTLGHALMAFGEAVDVLVASLDARLPRRKRRRGNRT